LNSGLCTCNRHSTSWAIPTVHFALVILEMKCWELFSWAGLKLGSSSSQPSFSQVAKITGKSHWCPAQPIHFCKLRMLSVNHVPCTITCKEKWTTKKFLLPLWYQPSRNLIH
jgi:hypothetical protein